MPLPEPADLFGFEPLPTYQPHSATSRAAAEFIAPKVKGIATEITEFLLANGPSTDADIAIGIGRSENSTRPRRISEEREGRIVAAGIGTSPSGRPATLWRVVEVGEPPGERRNPTGGSGGAGREAVSAGQRRQTKSTEQPASDVDSLWVEVRDSRPSWMSPQQAHGLLKAAIENNPGDLAAGLRQAVRDLHELGGGR